jgi:hypothetical protein
MQLKIPRYQHPNPKQKYHPDRSGGTCCSSSAAWNLNGSAALPFVIPSVPGFSTSPLSLATTYVVLSQENHMQSTEAANLDRKSGEAEGSAVPRTCPGNVFQQSVRMTILFTCQHPIPNRIVIPSEAEGPAVCSKLSDALLEMFFAEPQKKHAGGAENFLCHPRLPTTTVSKQTAGLYCRTT